MRSNVKNWGGGCSSVKNDGAALNRYYGEGFQRLTQGRLFRAEPRLPLPQEVRYEATGHVTGLLSYEGLPLATRGHGFFDDEMTESESGLEQRLREQSNANRANS